MIRISASGRLFTSFSSDAKQVIYEQIAKSLADAAREEIILKFDSSVKLASMIGQSMDQEALRAMYRSLKVDIKSIDPLKLEAKFKDDYSHWYGGEEIPQDMADTLQEIIESAVKNWFDSPEPGDIILKALVSL